MPTTVTCTGLDLDALSRICSALVPADGPDQLLDRINKADTSRRYRYVVTEHDWYRAGGVLSPDGERLADSLEEWIDTHFDGDMARFLAQYGDAGYRVTSLSGKTHFFAAGDGPGPLDFVQIEIDEVQEIMDPDKANPDQVPDSLEAIIEPPDPAQVPPDLVSPSRYVCRSVTRFSDLAESLTSDYTGDPDFRRFLAEWEHSSASGEIAFRDCWSINVLPVLADVGEHKYKVRLLSPFAEKADPGEIRARGTTGPVLPILERIDQDCGFAMAWYFLLIAQRQLSQELMACIRRDLAAGHQQQGGFAASDWNILESWSRNPYWL